jgi:hypothetical protein
MKFRFAITMAGCLALVLLAGCSISHHKNDSGNGDKDVDIRTPFGSLSVHEGGSDVKETGLAAYPGAREKKDVSHDRHGSANVNISSSLFGLKVVAMKFESDDTPDKVLAFYHKDMGKYGKVVDCTRGFTMSFHHHDMDSDVSCNDQGDGWHDYKEVLKVGTENNQRIMAVRPSGNGSEFTLVYVRAWDQKNTL